MWERLMNSFDFVNEETSIPFRVRIIRRGETYGVSARHNKNAPLVEFYDQRRTTTPAESGSRIATYDADQMLRPHPMGLEFGMGKATPKITAKNCEQIATWLRTEIDKPWTPPAPPPRPLPESLTGPIEPCDRRVTIFLGPFRYEATWFVVSRARDAQHKDAYHVRSKPKRARRLRSFIDHDGDTVIVDGWGHPNFNPLMGLVSSGTSTASLTIGANNSYEDRFQHYLANLPSSSILLDTRGVIIEEYEFTEQFAWSPDPAG
jgi:hypothetical protein